MILALKLNYPEFYEKIMVNLTDDERKILKENIVKSENIMKNNEN